MPTLDTALAFFGLALLLCYSPGPDNVFVLMQSAAHGRRAGLLVVLGLCTGLVVHTAALALGLAAVFAASAVAFTVVKFVGAAYLLYLAWGAWRAPVSAAGDGPAMPALSPLKLYGRGVLMNITNPKGRLFFMALLPQFVQPAQGPVALQLLALGGIFIVATLLAFGSIAWLAGFFAQVLRGSARAQRGLNRVSALVFAGLALRLATVSR
jgi:threonine/homoserine/homoserine lactone efflux protein